MTTELTTTTGRAVAADDPLADLTSRKSVEATRAFYAVFERDELRSRQDHFSTSRRG